MATSAGTSAGTPLSANGSQCGMLPAGNSAGRRDGGVPDGAYGIAGGHIPRARI